MLFAVGAVSGTVLSFEMGLLWPGLMSRFGDVIGLPFALEGIAFFVEAIFMGIYLYGWDRLPPQIHLWTLYPMMASGVFGTFCVVAVNAWMNAPFGSAIEDGQVVDVDPLAAMFNRALWPQFLHMWVAAYMVVGFVVAGGVCRGTAARPSRPPASGRPVDSPWPSPRSPQSCSRSSGMWPACGWPRSSQPSWPRWSWPSTTEDHSPVVIGGLLIDGEVRYGIEIPNLGSLLARGAFDREVTGLRPDRRR